MNKEETIRILQYIMKDNIRGYFSIPGRDNVEIGTLYPRDDCYKKDTQRLAEYIWNKLHGKPISKTALKKKLI